VNIWHLNVKGGQAAMENVCVRSVVSCYVSTPGKFKSIAVASLSQTGVNNPKVQLVHHRSSLARTLHSLKVDVKCIVK